MIRYLYPSPSRSLISYFRMVVVVCICSLVERGKERRERRSKPTVVYGQEWAQEIRGEGEDDQ
jgi:hypothetical protein